MEDPTTPVEEVPVLSVLKTSKLSVELTSSTEDELRAGSTATIKFNFTAVGTPIRDGSISLRIPRWVGYTHP